MGLSLLVFVRHFWDFARQKRYQRSPRQERRLRSWPLNWNSPIWRLKQLDEAKSDFLSIASHQPETPLTAIKGYASMILEGSYGKISETTKGAVDKIFQSSQRRFDNRRLWTSHIEQGTMQYDFRVR